MINDPLIFHLDHNYGSAHRCWYDFDKDSVFMGYENIYGFIFSTYGIGDVDINNACYIAKVKMERFVDKLAFSIVKENTQREIYRDECIALIISGRDFPVTDKVSYRVAEKDFDRNAFYLVPRHFLKRLRRDRWG